jgi:hypothetical protein
MLIPRAIGIALTLVSMAPSAWAADQLLTGAKLLIRNAPGGATGNRLVQSVRDASITLGAALGDGDPRCSAAGGGGFSALRIVAAGGAAGDVTIKLHCDYWSGDGTGTFYRYKDPTGSTCRHVLVRRGALIKAVCIGAQVAVDVDGGMSPVSVVLTLNTEKYCTEFGGTAVKDGSDDRVLLRKGAGAPAACPPPTTTTTVSTTTSTTILPPPCSGDPCGSCGGGSCYLHADPDPPTYVCAASCYHMACSDDSHCGPGLVCIMSVSTACCFPCP